MSDNKKNYPIYRLIIIVAMFFVVSALNFFAFDHSSNIVISIIYNLSLFTYLFFRLRKAPPKLKRITISICLALATFAGLILLDVIPLDDINPLFIIIPMATLGICVTGAVVYKLIKYLIAYSKV